MDKKRRNKISFVTTLFGLIANALLCAGKFAVGLLCGNIAVTADAVNNLSDAGNNVVTLIAIKVAGKPADKEHPFGHERVEYVSALVVAFIILFLGVELAVSSVEKIILNFKEPYLPEFDAWLVYVLSFSVVVKVVMFFVYRTNGKKAQSPVLKAMALDSIMDVAATAAVLAAILIGRLASVNLDGYMGLAVSVLIFVGGIKIAKDTVSGLIGVAPDKKLIGSRNRGLRRRTRRPRPFGAQLRTLQYIRHGARRGGRKSRYACRARADRPNRKRFSRKTKHTSVGSS